ncbi:hypothetical protein PoB_003542000 [Plakobranchus ocellatus]|uniref:Uncharacterized protein n=1 Tax=Plakobranchus ocellatus TaxID=259542 RepID=A0AAV4ANI2_9GAST|nr:hypothetical protein PoB_003542000 [Plakobranchus ocellatus]
MEEIQFLQEPSISPTSPMSLDTSAANIVVELMDGSDVNTVDFNRSRDGTPTSISRNKRPAPEMWARNIQKVVRLNGKNIYVSRSDKTVLERAIRPARTSNFCAKSALQTLLYLF